MQFVSPQNWQLLQNQHFIIYMFFIYMCVYKRHIGSRGNKKTLQCLTISKERMQTIQKTKVNTENMCSCLEEKMGFLTIC